MSSLYSQVTNALPPEFGFRSGQKGTHNTRTMMLADLADLLKEIPSDTSKEGYREAVVEQNLLAKDTASTRQYSFQRLTELYGLDPEIPLFRIFRELWDRSEQGRPLLAALLALARDPLLRLTAEPVLAMEAGERFEKTEIQRLLKKETGDRFSETSIKKISRLTGSSWTQAGHLEGRRKKTRERPEVSPSNTTYALVLGALCGVRGELLFDTFWARVLDAPEHEIHDQAQAASRRGMLTYRNAGGIIEVDISPVLTPSELEQLHEQN